MKKFLITIICGIILMPFLQSCQDLLKEENIRVPVADMYYKTAKGYNDLINSCYPPLRNIYGGYANMFQMNILGADLWLNGGDGSRNFGFYNILTPSDWVCWDVWKYLYSGITACNTAIDRAAELPDSEIPEAQLNDLLGQAYFLRAFYYHILAMQWGRVPLELKEITAVKTTAVRATEQQVYDQVINDLLLAEQLLPPTQNDYGRATKPAAQALLARVYLWTNKNAEAASYAKKVINDYDFQLLDDYADLWKMANQHNAEVIFAIPFTSDPQLSEGSVAHHLFLARYDIERGMIRDIANGRPFRHYMPSRHLLEMCQANRWRDSRFDKAYTTVWYANNPDNLLPEMTLGDTALYIVPYVASQEEKDRVMKKYTLYDINYYFDANSPNGWMPKGARHTFPALNKFLDPERESVASSQGSKDFFVIRLAEMHLIAAEALMKTGKADEGVNYINAVRLRAAWPGNEEDMKLTASELTIEAILDERAFELAGECVGRWPDLKRTGKLLEYARKYNPDASPNIQEYHLLRPIPQNMIDRITNKDEFNQNPGY